MLQKDFDRIVCINLDRREDRYTEFEDRWKGVFQVKDIERVSAVDGKICKPPSWWRQGIGAWGCYRTHLAIIEDALVRGLNSVLFLEDDALPVEDFADKYVEAMANLPTNWEMVYFGGQHLKEKQQKPKSYNENWVVPYNVNRTHAYALRGEGLHKAYVHLNETKTWRNGHHIDHHYGLLHMTHRMVTYAANPWLVGQAESHSDIKGRVMPERYWDPSKVKKVVVVLGLHRSGSSCLAGVLHRLGVYMGDKFVGCERDGGHEAQWLARFCEWAMRHPAIRPRNGWQLRLQREVLHFARNHQLCGIKYPHLCRFAAHLEKVLDERMLVVTSDRPLEDSIESLVRRDGNRIKPEKLAATQRSLWEAKQTFLMTTRRPIHNVDYYALMRDPEAQTKKLAEFLGVPYTEDAAAYVEKRLEPTTCSI